MKKNLNIAYLNGAEGMIRRGGASSGSSGSGEDNKSNIEYLDIRGWSKPNNKNVVNIVQRSAIVKLKYENYTICTYTANIISWSDNTSDVLDIFSTVTAIGIDFNLKIKLPDWEGTIKENLIKMGISEEYLNSLPRLTEEEFYNLND